MTPIPHFAQKAIDDNAWHLTQDDKVTLCGQPFRASTTKTKKVEPEPQCRACRLAFEARWVA